MIADETILWNATTGERLLEVGEPASDVSYVPERHVVVLAFASLHVVNAATGRRQTPEALDGLKAPMAACPSGTLAAYRPSDDAVVVGSVDGRNLRALRLGAPPPVALALSPDGGLLAIAQKERGLRVVRTHDLSTLLADEAPCRAIAFCGAGTTLLSSSDGALVARTARSGQVRWRRDAGGDVVALAISPQCTHAAAFDFWGDVQLLSMSDGAPEAAFKLARGEPHLAFIDEQTLACARASALKLFSVPEGKEVFRQETHDAEVTQAAVSHDGAIAATASIDHAARVWDLRQGTSLNCLQHENAVHSVALSADGSRIATTGSDDQVRLWRLPRGELIAQLARPGAGLGDGCVDFSPDGKLLATDVASGVQLLGGEDMSPVGLLEVPRPIRLLFLGNARLLLLTKRQLTVVEEASGRTLCKEIDEYEDVLAASPDGKHCAVRIGSHVVVRDTEGLREVRRFRVPLTTDCAFSTQSLLACTRFDERSVQIWNVAVGELESELSFHARPSAVCFVDARTLLVGMRDGCSETATLPLSAREKEEQARRELSEREERARDVLRQVARRAAPGYRDSPGRSLVDATGLGLKIPDLEPRQGILRITVDKDAYRMELVVAESSAAPPPDSAFVRMGRWIRSRLGLSKPAPADPRDAKLVSELEKANPTCSVDLGRVGREAVSLVVESRDLPDPETLRSWVARALELLDDAPE